MADPEELRQRIQDAYSYDELLDILLSYDSLAKEIAELLGVDDEEKTEAL